jgi:primosomal protein N' (replication factor Y)
MSRLVEVAVPLPLQDAYTYRVPEALAELVGLGARVEVPFGRRALVGYVVGFPEHTEVPRLKDIVRLVDDPPLLGPRLLDLARWMAEYYACSLGEALRAVLPTGVDRKRGRPRGRDVEGGERGVLLEPAPPTQLNAWQAVALGRVEARLEAGGFEAFLLHGVTGSGKTEVYLHAIRQAAARGLQSIVLIPEIALTPQVADRFRSRLGTEVGILHSAMTHAERHDVLRAAARGEIQVVLGARSAVFAPFRRLGLVVVDEEQEGSYKQNEKPRYHARSVALVRATLEGAAVLLGSATPSLESYQNTRSGKHVLLHIPERVDGRPLPRVHLVDMRAPEHHGEVLARPLLDALADRLERHEQAILLLNRRGHSNYVQCFGCGEIVRCPYCDISLTYHATDRRLRCHYCNHARAVPDDCPTCGNPCQVFRGIGTQRLEQDLRGLLPDARLARMDFDTTSKRGAHRRILEDFARGAVDILLGTQMVAKGHDFPGVTLVGVVQADAGLSLPDFRAAERTFQLLSQVAGRAGRGSLPGDVYVQTLCPDHEAIRLAAAHDFPTFFAHEAELRRSLHYPPFARLLQVTGLGPERPRLSAAMQELAGRLRAGPAGRGAQVLGPAESPIPRLRGRYREHLLVKGSPTPEAKHQLLLLLAEVARGAPGVEFQVDVDPVDML